MSVLPSALSLLVLVAVIHGGTAGGIRPEELTRKRKAINEDVSPSEVEKCVEKARDLVSKASKATDDHYENPSKGTSPYDLLGQFRRPDAKSKAMSFSQEVYELSVNMVQKQAQENVRATSKLMSTKIEKNLLGADVLEQIAELSGCKFSSEHVKCSGDNTCFNSKYRTIDGTCNNIDNPTWGASHQPYMRILPAAYEDGIGLPRGWTRDRKYNGYALPSARLVTNRVLAAKDTRNHSSYTHMFMTYGHFVGHDMMFSAVGPAEHTFETKIPCSKICQAEAPCFPIEVPDDDWRINKTTNKCIGFTRSAATCGTGAWSGNNVRLREQLNTKTAFIDASQVYGSVKEIAGLVRSEQSRHLLKVGEKWEFGRKHMLPVDERKIMACLMDKNLTGSCMLAGDHRANEQPSLLSLHTIFVRLHNIIADHLRHNVNYWSDDVMFQEARKIIGGMLQHITFKHYLPKVLGPRGMQQLGPYAGYDPTVRPDILNEFTTAAYRYGHAFVQPQFFRLDNDFNVIPEGNLPLRQAYFAPFRLLANQGGTDAILRGVYARPAKHHEPGQVMTHGVTEELFVLAHAVGLDLASFDIQRGRDHGMQPYTSYLQWCGLATVTSWDHLREFIKDDRILSDLQDLYGHYHNIDLAVGIYSEDLMEGAALGPTGVCIMVEQFRRVRAADRFWYERPGVFTDLQLHQIRRSSLAKIICDTSENITRVQKDVFLLPDSDDEFLKCSDIPGVDLDYWRECCDIGI